jgi:hypothetical protein
VTSVGDCRATARRLSPGEHLGSRSSLTGMVGIIRLPCRRGARAYWIGIAGSLTGLWRLGTTTGGYLRGSRRAGAWVRGLPAGGSNGPGWRHRRNVRALRPNSAPLSGDGQCVPRGRPALQFHTQLQLLSARVTVRAP